MRTIWYMGVKTRLIEGFIDRAIADCAARGATVLDAASGSAAVATALAPHYRVVANDVQEYGAAIARAYLCHDERAKASFVASIDPERDLGHAFRENYARLAEPLADALVREDAFLRAFELEPAARDDGTTLREPEIDRRAIALPRGERELARAYRDFALRATPRFSEVEDARADGPFARARSLFARRSVLERRRDPERAPYLLATTYYPNVYLGIRQAIAADSLRFAIDRLDARDPFAAKKREHYLAALLHALSVTTSATSHFCQPRGLGRDSEVRAVLTRRSTSLASRLESFSREIRATIGASPLAANGVLTGDWRALFTPDGEGDDAWAVPGARADVVYLDPPYTNDNYSRFYHLLEVIARYDYPELDVRRGRVTKGRYPARALRHQSAFCKRSTVERELADVLASCARAGAAAVVSYAFESGLLLRRYREDEGLSPDASLRRFEDLARVAFGSVELRKRKILHSGQGRLNEPATELLLVCREPRRASRRSRVAARAS